MRLVVETAISIFVVAIDGVVCVDIMGVLSHDCLWDAPRVACLIIQHKGAWLLILLLLG